MRTPTGSPRVILTAVSAALAGLLVAAIPPHATAAGPELPDDYVISVAGGLATEGIAIGPGGKMFVSSDATGQLFAGNIRSGELTPFDAAGATDRGTSLGIDTGDTGLVWSVGAGTLTLHNRSGHLLAARTVQAGPLGEPDLNDVAVTEDAVYVTDWANPIVHRAVRDGARVGELEPWLDMRDVIPGFPAQYWLLNGIVADEAGDTVLVASNGTEAVWRVDTATREVRQLDVGDQSFGADGMVLDGTTLYAVINYGAPSGVYIAELDPDLTSGSITHRLHADAHGQAFRLPTTLAVYDCRLYVVNYETTGPEAPHLVSAVPDPTCP